MSIRDFRKFTEIIPVMAKNNPNIESEFMLKDNNVVRGILKENYMLTAYRDIVAIYGSNLPGMWFMVGILDSLNKLIKPITQGFRKSMDEFSAVAETLYREGNPKYTITPFLIFRGLEK